MSSDGQFTGTAEEVFTTLGDDLSREILINGLSETVTASSLSDALDVAPATVYRRINTLEELGLIHEVTDIFEKPSSESAYRTDVRALVLGLSSDGFDIEQAESKLQAAVSILLDEVDINEASFSFDSSTATVTLTTDNEAFQRLHDCYHAARREREPFVGTETTQ